MARNNYPYAYANATLLGYILHTYYTHRIKYAANSMRTRNTTRCDTNTNTRRTFAPLILWIVRCSIIRFYKKQTLSRSCFVCGGGCCWCCCFCIHFIFVEILIQCCCFFVSFQIKLLSVWLETDLVSLNQYFNARHRLCTIHTRLHHCGRSQKQFRNYCWHSVRRASDTHGSGKSAYAPHTFIHSLLLLLHFVTELHADMRHKRAIKLYKLI